MCLNGKCVSEHENAIDYGDGSFLRRTGSAEISSFVQDTSSTKRTWWNQITTPSTTTTTSSSTQSPVRASKTKTTMPWWKRLQQKTKKQRPATESTTLVPKTSPATLSTTTITTTTTKKSTTTTKKPFKSLRTVSKTKTKKSEVVENTLGTSEVCEDRITNIAGSMSCKAFLRSFAYQYCRHKYIKKNCCSSHQRFCSGSTHGRL